METEPGAELPREVDAVIAMLLGRLSLASRDTGNAYYADFYPINPESPDEYTVEISITKL